MEITTLNLLFNYKGGVSYREFRAGFVILFITAVTTILLIAFNKLLPHYFAGSVEAEHMLSFYQYRDVTWPFIPALVPAQFILSYSAFILVMKRVRTLNGSGGIGVISGFINFLLFASFVSLWLTIFTNEGAIFAVWMEAGAPLYAFAGIFVAGLVNFICLAFRRKRESIVYPIHKGRLDAVSYAIRIGNVIGIMIVLSLLASVIAFFSLFDLIDNEILRAVTVLYCLVPLGFCFKYIIYRLNDAGVSIGWLISFLVIYLLISGGYWFAVYYFPHLFGFCTSLFEISATLFVFIQYLPLLLPTQSGRGNALPAVKTEEESQD